MSKFYKVRSSNSDKDSLKEAKLCEVWTGYWSFSSTHGFPFVLSSSCEYIGVKQKKKKQNKTKQNKTKTKTKQKKTKKNKNKKKTKNKKEKKKINRGMNESEKANI